MIAKKIRKVKRLMFSLFLVLCMAACCILNAEESSAVSVSVIPDNSTIVPSAYIFNTGYSNASWTINSAYQSSITVMDRRTSSGCISFTVTRNTGAARTFTNPLSVVYENAGEINGRPVNIKLNVDRLIQTGSTDTNIANCSGEFLCLWYGRTDVSSYKTTGSRYKLTHTTDISYTVTYADTGEVVELPCFQAVADLDTFQNVASVAEGFVPISGYIRAYIYSACALVQKNGGFFAPSQLEVSGNESYTRTGLYAETGNGQFAGRYYTTNCRTQLLIYSQYRDGMLPAPELSIDDTHPYEEGDEVVIDVRQKAGTFFVDTITKYTSFEIADDIPDGLTYKSAAVYNQSGDDVTGMGTLDYYSSSGTVAFRFSDSFIQNQDSYDGSTYTLRITTEADPIDEGDKIIDDTALSRISSVEQRTSEQHIRIVKPFHVNYEYVSGTQGKNLPGEIDTESGPYKICDDAVYYKGDTVQRKDSPADDTVFEITDGESNPVGFWVLKWDSDSKTAGGSDVTFTGTWRYVYTPRMIVEKRLAADYLQFTEAHGSVSFIFRVTGVSGGNSWYRSMTFDSAVINALKENGYYKKNDGTEYGERDGYIYARTPYIYLPEDDYIVEEVNTLRFDNKRCIAGYHKASEDIVTGESKNSIEVPLRLSSYTPADEGYDAEYASVIFENEKVKWGGVSHSCMMINRLKEAE